MLMERETEIRIKITREMLFWRKVGQEMLSKHFLKNYYGYELNI